MTSIAIAEVAKTTSDGGLKVTLDIAALLSTLIWPVVLLTLFVKYRKEIPGLIKGVAHRVTKFEVAGISIELAKAKEFAPVWTAGAFDLRQKAAAIQVNDSTAGNFLTQLREQGDADYAEVNLGSGEEWLTSRLFIMAIIFARMKAIRSFVFLETAGGVRKRFVCLAKPERIRWALARRFPWLEQAYADAYSTVISRTQAFVVSNSGKLGYQFSQNDPGPSIELLKEYLLRVQNPAPLPAESESWVLIDIENNTFEHARWLNSEELEDLLGKDANRATIRSSELRPIDRTRQLGAFLALPGQFVAVTAEDQRFEYLVDRNAILEQVANN
jgi:hypothetical protein